MGHLFVAKPMRNGWEVRSRDDDLPPGPFSRFDTREAADAEAERLAVLFGVRASGDDARTDNGAAGT